MTAERADLPGTMVRVSATIDDATFELAQGQDIVELKRRIEEAAATTGRFVEFTVIGDCDASVLITASSRVSIASETVYVDPRDPDEAFDGFLDHARGHDEASAFD